MRAVIQRVSQASVLVNHETVGEIGCGLLVLLGVEVGDTQDDLNYMVKKTANLRIFEDLAGKMNLSLQDVSGKMLAISQFTLLGDVSRGNRPSFIQAAAPEFANTMYESFVREIRARGLDVETGIFRADMKVSLINDGPVTIVIDSKATGR